MMCRSSEQWLALFDQCKASGLTQTEFAKQHRIDPSYTYNLPGTNSDGSK
ncbi:IS66 family insertion sequence element accessory protein TnpA [Rheinheimera sediminis]|nr:hypothetical protein [Rheinheimera sp. YQF-1]